MYMQDWVKKLDEYLRMSDYGVLEGKGERTAAQAQRIAEREFNLYHKTVMDNYQSDFDLFLSNSEAAGLPAPEEP